MQNLGKSYDTLLQERSHGFSEAEVTQILKQVLPQLAQLHAQGQVHGAISPKALIQDPQTLAPVLIEASNTSVAGYTAPELLATGQGSLSGDIYALGVTMLVLLTHQPPNMLQGVDGTWLWEDHCMVSDQLATVLETAVAPSVAMRYANAMQMQQALIAPVAVASPVITQYVAQPNIQVVMPSPSKTRLNLAGWQWGAIGAGGALLLGLAGFGVFSMVAPKSEVSVVNNPLTEVSPSPNGGQSSPDPGVIAEPNLGNTTNPFEQGFFPQAVCGDSLPVGQQYYPVHLYPVFLDYSEGNLQAVQSRFCHDALKKIRQGTGKLSVQVASFTTLERAEFFRVFIARRFGSAEIGQPTTILSNPNDRGAE
jgi:serine/threonine protein kinase